jgi:hypothetical protein
VELPGLTMTWNRFRPWFPTSDGASYLSIGRDGTPTSATLKPAGCGAGFANGLRSAVIGVSGFSDR